MEVTWDQVHSGFTLDGSKVIEVTNEAQQGLTVGMWIWEINGKKVTAWNTVAVQAIKDGDTVVFKGT